MATLVFVSVVVFNRKSWGDNLTCQGEMWSREAVGARMSLSLFIYCCLQYVLLPVALDLCLQ